MEQGGKTNTALPEVRNNGTAIQWKYSDETDWRDLVALTELRGAAGENGKDGVNGENGTDGKDGLNGTNGQNGANGKDGINGVDGKDGADGKTARTELTEPTVKTALTPKHRSTKSNGIHTVALRGRRVAEPCGDRRYHRPYWAERRRRH